MKLKDRILHELKSILKTFLAGVLMFLLANWDMVVQMDWLSFERSVYVGFALALLRAGVKAIWAYIEPKLQALIKWLINKLK